MSTTENKTEKESAESGPELVIIAALAKENRVIGKGLELPWHIPDDLKRFKRLTLGAPLIMGRVTFQSLVEQFGGPLKGRRHLVLTRSKKFTHPAAEIFHSMDNALAAVADEPIVWMAGGASIYRMALPISDRMELTLIDGEHEGDAFFPEYDAYVGSRYEVTERDERDGFAFVTYGLIAD